MGIISLNNQMEGTNNAPIMDSNSKIEEIESILTKNIKSKTLTDEAFGYMAMLIIEDAPKNAKELYALLNDFLTDGMTYSEENSMKLCQ